MIIAIIPAPGHEALIARDVRSPDHPAVLTERPATIDRCLCGAFVCRQHYMDGHGFARPVVRALVLFAPGDPKLGMLRAGAALGDLYQCNEVHGRVVAEVPYMGDSVEVEAPAGFSFADFNAVDALGLAHLLVQRGIAAEVIVLPADKAKEAP